MRKIRAVIDTNVFVSGAIFPKGSPRRILEMAERKIFETVTSPLINQEILSVLHRENIYAKYGINEDIVDGIASFLYEGTILTQGFYQVSRIKQDPEDNKVHRLCPGGGSGLYCFRRQTSIIVKELQRDSST